MARIAHGEEKSEKGFAKLAHKLNLLGQQPNRKTMEILSKSQSK